MKTLPINLQLGRQFIIQCTKTEKKKSNNNNSNSSQQKKNYQKEAK